MNIVNDHEENYVTGYVSIYRSVLKNNFWLAEKFTRGQAWVDLLLLAKYKKGFFYKREIKVNYNRGDVTEGIVNLSKRWKWSRNKTQKFINDLEKEHQIKQQKSNVITLLSIVNYNLYQKKNIKKDNSRTPSDTTAGHQQDTHNKDNNINKERETSLTPLDILNKDIQFWETLEMQNKKRFKDWDKMLELFNYKVDEEKLQYDFNVLKARLFRWMSNWESNIKNDNTKPKLKPGVYRNGKLTNEKIKYF